MTDCLDWDKPEVALAQFKLAQRELAGNVNDILPYKEFLRLMHAIDYAGKSMIDVGCGVGHYSALVDDFLPELGSYTGCDISEHMIAIAKKAFRSHDFFVADWAEVDCNAYDIILLSSLVEVIPNHHEALQHILREARWAVLLHRVRISKWPTKVATEASYGEYKSLRVTHNRDELIKALYDNNDRRIIRERIWYAASPTEQMASYIVYV